MAELDFIAFDFVALKKSNPRLVVNFLLDQRMNTTTYELRSFLLDEEGTLDETYNVYEDFLFTPVNPLLLLQQ